MQTLSSNMVHHKDRLRQRNAPEENLEDFDSIPRVDEKQLDLRKLTS